MVNKNGLFIISLVFLLLASYTSYAMTKDVPAFLFLLIEPGGRPAGMGKAFTGVADDANAAFYNPGGLALQEKNSFTAMYEPRGLSDLPDIFYNYVASSFNAGKYGTFSAAVIYSDAGRSDITDEQNRVLGTMHSYGVAPSLYWSYPVLADLGVGGGLTYAYEHLTDQAGGVNQQLLFNGGVLYRTPLKGLSCGLAFIHIGPNKTSSGTENNNPQSEYSWPAPRTMRLGLSYKVLSNDLNDLLVTADASKLLMNLNDHLNDELGQAVYSGGAEYVYAKMVAVRAGYYQDRWGEIKGLSLGFGFTYHGLSFDYARVPEGQLFNDQNRFAVGYTF